MASETPCLSRKVLQNKIKKNTNNISKNNISKNTYSINQKLTKKFETNTEFENGVKQGKKEKNIEIARKMIYKGIELETIMEITRLTMLELIKIK